MKIRIEGCTQQELAEYSPYLSLGKVYSVRGEKGDRYGWITDEDDESLSVRIDGGMCVHVPVNAKWVEVTE